MRPAGGFLWALASLVLAASLFAGAQLLPRLHLFRVESIVIEGAVRTAPEEVRRTTGVQTGTGLLSLDVARVRQAVRQLPWVRSCQVSRRLPSTLNVRIEEHEPRALIRLDQLYYLSREGRVIQAPLTEGIDYPVVTGLSWADIEGDGPLRRRLLQVFELLDAGRLDGEAGEIHADPGTGFTLYTPAHGGTGIRLGFDALEEKFARLARLGRHLATRGQTAYAVNLVYEDKIIARLAAADGRDPRP